MASIDVLAGLMSEVFGNRVTKQKREKRKRRSWPPRWGWLHGTQIEAYPEDGDGCTEHRKMK